MSFASPTSPPSATAWAKAYVPNVGWLPVDWVASYRPGGPRTVRGAITHADILKPNFCLYYVNAHCDPMTERKDIFLGWNEGMIQKLHGHEMHLEVSVELAGAEPWGFEHATAASIISRLSIGWRIVVRESE